MVGVCGIARPGFCQPTLLEKLSVVPAVVPGNSILALTAYQNGQANGHVRTRPHCTGILGPWPSNRLPSDRGLESQC